MTAQNARYAIRKSIRCVFVDKYRRNRNDYTRKRGKILISLYECSIAHTRLCLWIHRKITCGRNRFGVCRQFFFTEIRKIFHSKLRIENSGIIIIMKENLF